MNSLNSKKQNKQNKLLEKTLHKERKMYQKTQTAITLILSVIACYTSFLAVLTLCFNSGERINLKVNQSFRFGFNKQMINNNKDQTTNNNHSFQHIINKLTDTGYNISQEITLYANTQNQPSCRTNLCKFQSFIKTNS